MKIIFLSTINVLALLMVLNCLKLNDMKNLLASGIAKMGYVTIASVLLYNFFMFSPSVFWADLSYSLFYITIDMFIIFSVYYVDLYCNIGSDLGKNKSVVCVLLIVDIISLLVNPFTNHVFKCFVRIMSDKSEIWMTIINNFFYYYHFISTFIVGLMVLGTLLYKAIISPSIYKRKYFVLIFLIGLICVSEFIICTSMQFFAYTIIVYQLTVLVASVLPFLIYMNIATDINGIIIKDANEAMICFDIEGKCININNEMRKIIDCPKAYVGLEQKFYDFLGEYALDNLNNVGVYTINLESGIIPKSYFVTKVYVEDRFGDRIGWYYSIVDKTEQKRIHGEDSFAASHDKLTKFYNRSAFYSKVDEELVNNSDTKYYLICTNIKDFKIFNDIFGSDIGDNLLRKIALGLSIHKTEKQVLARLEADRFAFLMPKDEYNEKQFKEYLRGVSRAFSTNVYKVNIRAGIYEIDDTSLPVQSMCDRAMLAMNSLNDEHGISVAYFSNNLLDDSIKEKRIISEFESAIKNEQFQIYLQPIVDKDGVVLGAESLVRWNSPTLGFLQPGSFISIFEKCGFVYRLDEYVWTKACQILKSWELMGITDKFISINISYRDFFYMDVKKILVDITEEYRVNKENLRLEFTETVMANDFNYCNEVISELKKAGFIIEIDDFGSGYSSFNLLKDMDFVDVIKLDLGIIKECAESDRALKIISSIIKLASDINTQVIAEGVESKEQLDALIKVGCDSFQGYYFAKPMEENLFDETYFTDE